MLWIDEITEHARLDSYIAACEELEHALLPIAYRLGKEQKNGNEQKWPPE